MQVASLLSPHAPTTPKGASHSATAPERPDHKDEDFEAGGDRELQSAMSTFNEATFETAQVSPLHVARHTLVCAPIQDYWPEVANNNAGTCKLATSITAWLAEVALAK